MRSPCPQAADEAEGVRPAAPGPGDGFAEGMDAGRWRWQPPDEELGSISLSPGRSRTKRKAAEEGEEGISSQEGISSHTKGVVSWCSPLSGTTVWVESLKQQKSSFWGQVNEIDQLCSWSAKRQLCCEGEGEILWLGARWGEGTRANPALPRSGLLVPAPCGHTPGTRHRAPTRATP